MRYFGGPWWYRVVAVGALAAVAPWWAGCSGHADTSPVARASSALDSCSLSTPCSIWSTSDTPAGEGYSSPVTLGLQWQASEAGYVSGITFYKEDGESTHTVDLWDSSGDLLASATSSSETASGWQSVVFSSPVAVSADTTYVASYTMASGGDYASSSFSGPVTNGPLTALATNSFYASGSTPTFPQSQYDVNFFVDVLFANAANVDDAGGTEDAGTPCLSSAPCTLFAGAAPAGAGYSSPVTLGMQWQTSQSGYISGVAFYKQDGQSSHTVDLWDSSGDLLASATSSSETASGWQTVAFSSPLAVSADTTYVASYTMAAGGDYASSALSGPVTSGPLTLLATNSFYAIGSTPTFPQTQYDVDFGVDVDFYDVAVAADAGSDASSDSGAQATTCLSSAPCSIYSTSFTPTGAGYSLPVTLGIQWQTVEAGYVSGIAFYKEDGQSSHTVDLWDSSGDLLASATSSSETGSGWQTVALSSPFAVSANTTYVVSYTMAAGGDYAASAFSGPVVSGPLTALATNSFYASGSAPTFPNIQYDVNFAVDVDFYDVVSDAGAGGDAGGDATTLDSGAQATTCLSSSPCSILTTADTPSGPGYSSPVTLGVQWQTVEAGYVSGVAFYKEDGQSTHTIDLWDSSGDVLASTTSANETASGWQTVTFASPVAVSANSTYVASYTMAAGGEYGAGPFSGPVVNGPLTALATNGVYAVGSSPTFPQASFGQNFFVDVLFYNTAAGTDAGSSDAAGDTGAASDDSSDGSDETGEAGTDGGDPSTSTVTITGTITGTIPSGDNFILYRLVVGYDTVAGEGQFENTPYLVVTADGGPASSLPATYQTSLSFAGDLSAGVNLRVWFAPSLGSLNGTSYTAPCGCLEGSCASAPYNACGYGAPSITTTNVVCNLDTATATSTQGEGDNDECY
jgi:hypothetical protein